MTTAISHHQVSTTSNIPGYRVTRSFGVVRGITVRSRSIVGNIGAALQTLVGGNISIYAELCEKAREDAFELMLQHAAAMGANAVVGMRTSSLACWLHPCSAAPAMYLRLAISVMGSPTPLARRVCALPGWS